MDHNTRLIGRLVVGGGGGGWWKSSSSSNSSSGDRRGESRSGAMDNVFFVFGSRRFFAVHDGGRGKGDSNGKKAMFLALFSFFSEGGSLGHWRYSGSGDGARKLLFSVVAPLCAVCTSQHHNAQHRRAT